LSASYLNFKQFLIRKNLRGDSSLLGSDGLSLNRVTDVLTQSQCLTVQG